MVLFCNILQYIGTLKSMVLQYIVFFLHVDLPRGSYLGTTVDLVLLGIPTSRIKSIFLFSSIRIGSYPCTRVLPGTQRVELNLESSDQRYPGNDKNQPVRVYRYLEYSWVRKFYSVLQDIVCTALYCSTWYYEQVPLLEYRFGHFSQLGSGISQIKSPKFSASKFSTRRNRSYRYRGSNFKILVCARYSCHTKFSTTKVITNLESSY